MEASQPGRREADVAPAPAATTTSVGWSPANPAPLGLAGFPAPTFILSMINTNQVSAAGAIGGVLAVALAYGGIAQLLAGMWEFRAGNTFGPAVTHSGFSLYLYAWTIFTLIMLIASLRTNGVLVAIFAMLTITFLLLAIGNASLTGLQATNGTIKIGGWTGIVTAILAWYGVLAIVTNSTFGRDVLPLFPLTR